MPPKRMIGRAVILLVLAAAAGVYCAMTFGRRGGSPGQDYTDLGAVLRKHFADWAVARGPDVPGPYRVPTGMGFPRAEPGQPLVGTLGSPRGQLRYNIPPSANREQVLVPLETADGRLTYAVVQHELAGQKP